MFRFLIPKEFKNVAWGLLGLSLALIFFGGKLNIGKMRLESIISIMGLVGFALLIISKEKDEDERTMFSRYKALSQAFYFLIFMEISTKIIDLIYEFATLHPFNTSLVYISFLVYYSNFRRYLKVER
ncbi:MAG: hypothetical protein H7296_02120 [Bacteroidia bacterium]|nr:hypothetical protein [Bacteroidia bacterium]